MLFKLLFSLPVILSTASVIVLLIALRLFILRKQGQLFRTVATLLIGLGLLAFFYTYQKKQKKKVQPLTSVAMFKKMEYLEHLKLVSFYSEEVVVLGTKEKVQKLVDKLNRQFDEWKVKARVKELFIDSLQNEIDALDKDFITSEKVLTRQKIEVRRFEKVYKDFSKCNFKQLCMLGQDTSELDINFFYQDYKTASQAFWVKDHEFSTKPWRNQRNRKARAKERRQLKEERDHLELDMVYKHQLVTQRLERALEFKETDLKTAIDKFLVDKKQARDARGNLVKWRKKSRKEWEKALNKRQKVKKKLDEAKLELEFAKESGEEIDPEVLIVLPAEVSVFIDMKKLQLEGIEKQDSLLTIIIPELEFDPVLIDLPDSSAVYQLDRKESEWVGTYQGAYYDLFGQLKEAVLEKQIEVKEKAIENGILEEGRKMAESYIKNFIAPLGLEIEFKEREKVDP